MLRLLSLCLLQVLIVGLLLATTPSVSAQDTGIRIRGPKSTDVFPHDRYGPITSSDTLWKIALAIRPDPSVTVYQVMQALYEMNPNAFADNNRNHLINGQYLLVPPIEKIRLIDPYVAKNSAVSDDKKWQGKVAKKAEPVVPVKPEELVVKKKDLDAAKGEINQQLQTYDTEQRQKLDTIQRDVLDSIDGLQAILQENEALRQRLANFNDQLTLMQGEVAKGQEVKAQMDSMLELQKELLAKAEERERQLLLEKQQAELAQQNWMSSLWFKVLMGTLPALLIAGVIAFFIGRKKQEKQQPAQEMTLEKPAPAAEAPVAQAASETLDEELSLDGELSLDDELSIDLTESEEDESDDLFADTIDDLGDELLDDDLSDEVIHLDDELDELDDLEDISLDDDLEKAEEESEPLEGGELDQSMLDDLLSGGDDSEKASMESEEPELLEGGQLDQGDLDDLLSGLGSDDSDDVALAQEDDDTLPDGELGQDDLDALLAGASDEKEIPDGADVTDPDDIDALLASAGGETEPAPEPATEPEPEPESKAADDIPDGADVTDPDDIDALLASVGGDSTPEPATEPEPEPESKAADDIPDGADVTDPDDIDALLASVGGDSAPEPEPEPESKAADDIPDGADVTDPDDIDALLASVGGDSAPEPESKAADEIPDGADVTDPDDIDALLASVGGDSAPEPESKAADDIPDGADVTDPDDIDALLASVGGEAEPKPAPEPQNSAADDIPDGADVTDPDDIDALLASINGESLQQETSVVDDGDMEITDPDDIDALLNSINGDSAESASDNGSEQEAGLAADQLEENVDLTDAAGIEQLLGEEDNSGEASEHHAQIEAFTEEYVAPFLNADFSDMIASDNSDDTQLEGNQPEETAAPTEVASTDNTASQEMSDDFDIDSLIADVQADIDTSEPDDTLDIGDDLLSGFEQSDEQLTSDDVLEDSGVNESTLEVSAESIDQLAEAMPQDADDLSGDELLADMATDFDESTLSELLNDEKEAGATVELTPDFTDSNVLADLLAEGEPDGETEREAVTEANEIEDIQELDSLDFDELLANIEEESTGSDDDHDFDLSDELDIGDELVIEASTAPTNELDIELPAGQLDKALSSSDSSSASDSSGESEQDFVSVDSLLSDSLQPSTSEPYQKTNIDVGLNEFPEFTQDANNIDVDDDDNGIAAKLDLAKVYLEIGDSENAEIILTDVVEKGDAQQQFEAQQLLENLK
ncbi:hypothetical protein DXX93_14435 [Thalassotalea euphylliae]|uniref:Pilus assembly protein FimV n=1 Tax=Thalassotalea euphylliae TaxID=1655234 RepID=A0A3E0TT37_9GAMM|nr:FimV/HubP family polar landmark protein [Thalassotalea euphylliae]REL27633.1 hypothetical protein DXX93_14435 [Thalassotalea euphylliae]